MYAKIENLASFAREFYSPFVHFEGKIKVDKYSKDLQASGR